MAGQSARRHPCSTVTGRSTGRRRPGVAHPLSTAPLGSKRNGAMDKAWTTPPAPCHAPTPARVIPVNDTTRRGVSFQCRHRVIHGPPRIATSEIPRCGRFGCRHTFGLSSGAVGSPALMNSAHARLISFAVSKTQTHCRLPACRSDLYRHHFGSPSATSATLAALAHAPLYRAGPVMAGSSLPAIDNLLVIGGAVSPAGSQRSGEAARAA